MKLTCPHCGGETDLAAMTQAAELLALARAQAAFGDDWSLVSEYLDGFRTSPDRPLKVTKRLRLAREVYRIYLGGRFEFGGQAYQVDRPELREALAAVGNRELTGLKNHNYLKQVLKAAAHATSIRQEREFKEREGRLRAGVREGPSQAGKPVPLGEVLGKIIGETPVPQDPEWRAEFRRRGRELRKPGLTPEERAAAKTAYEAHLANRPGTANN